MKLQGSVDTFSINDALQTVSPADRAVYKLHHYGFSSKDIAIFVNSTEDIVNYRISHIKALMFIYLLSCVNN